MAKERERVSNKEDEEEPELSPVDSEDEDSSVYDSDQYEDEPENSESESSSVSFEDQGSSDEDEDLLDAQQKEDDDVGSDDGIAISYENVPRTWKTTPPRGGKRKQTQEGEKKTARFMHTDDWSSDDDDEDGTGNRIGKVPLHWYDDFDHIGYDGHGQKVVKSASGAEGGDRIDQVLAMQDNVAKGKFVVHDALNDRNVDLTPRQIELIRRVQAGAYAHPEHDANPEYIDYYSGVDRQISGLNSNMHEPKARFQPSKFEKLQVERLLAKLESGKINMDYLTGKIRDMNDANKKFDPTKPYMLWTGDEEDLLNMRKGPQHIPPPKVPPPGHAHSYRPPDEYLPTEEEKKQWEELAPKDRPHGHLVPKKFPSLRSVGSYQHSVREMFERCLDLYLCPRIMKRRLNIDPESLVPRLPQANDLKPFPNAKCIEYETPYDKEGGDEAPIIRCITASPDGQFMASGATDGIVRLWEVQTGRLLQSWDISSRIAAVEELLDTDDNDIAEDTATANGTRRAAKPVVALEWNPNHSHHCLLAAVGNTVVVIATGTANKDDAGITEALLSCALQSGNVTSAKAAKAVKWVALVPESDSPPLSRRGKPTGASENGVVGAVCALRTSREVASVRWQSKGDYFVSVCPKAGAAAVLIHQLSKGNSQQPFNKAKGEVQLACFHPSKPFLFVASQQHIRIYHLVKQNMVKRLVSGCRWISSMDMHPTGDHLIIGSLDRRMVWFDLDLSATPFKTLKYHERALRSVKYHTRYPLMASASDDGAVHVFHSMVYSDLMRNPLVVPVKILRGHTITNNLGVLTLAFHPKQPWLFSGGADGRIFLYQDI